MMYSTSRNASRRRVSLVVHWSHSSKNEKSNRPGLGYCQVIQSCVFTVTDYGCEVTGSRPSKGEHPQ